MRIAKGLGTTPNWLLGLNNGGKKPNKREALIERVTMATQELADEDIRLIAIQIEAGARG